MNTDRYRFPFALLTALATLGLVCMGGLVTSKGVGMAVPDWPTSFGYNMFALPVNQWFHGGVFDEHTHRLWASSVGLLVVLLTRWMGGSPARKPLAMVGALEIVAGIFLLRIGPEWRGGGAFLASIGAVVGLAAAIPGLRIPAEGVLPRLAWAAFVLVQVQGLLGGLRVVLDKALVGHVTLGTLFGLVHGCLGQTFFVLLGVIALLSSPWWARLPAHGDATGKSEVRGLLLATGCVALQLVLGASMRHQHAGLAILDFPLAYGRWWPLTDPESVARYNQVRMDESTVTAVQIQLQMLHRLGAVAAVVAILTMSVRVGRRFGWASPLGRGVVVWSGIAFAQFTLGMLTIWTNKAADVATAHVAGGASLLLLGTALILTARRLTMPASAGMESSRTPGLPRAALQGTP
ncbi:MAG: COX15/CtaA family protein [Verrucomicrobiota bacterium]